MSDYDHDSDSMEAYFRRDDELERLEFERLGRYRRPEIPGKCTICLKKTTNHEELRSGNYKRCVKCNNYICYRCINVEDLISFCRPSSYSEIICNECSGINHLKRKIASLEYKLRQLGGRG